MPSTDRDELKALIKNKLEEKCYRFFDDPTGTKKTIDEIMQPIDDLITQKQKEARAKDLEYAIDLLRNHDPNRTLAGEIAALQDRILRLQSPDREEDNT